MSKIIKHTFKLPNLTVKDGELVEDKETTATYTFTLLFKGIGLYEEISGKPLINSLMNALGDGSGSEMEAVEKMMDKKFIRDLACASYVKIVGDKFHNNRATAEEFKKSQVFPYIENDYEFIVKLITMATECIYDKNKGIAKGASKPKK